MEGREGTEEPNLELELPTSVGSELPHVQHSYSKSILKYITYNTHMSMFVPCHQDPKAHHVDVPAHEDIEREGRADIPIPIGIRNGIPECTNTHNLLEFYEARQVGRWEVGSGEVHGAFSLTLSSHNVQ